MKMIQRQTVDVTNTSELQRDTHHPANQQSDSLSLTEHLHGRGAGSRTVVSNTYTCSITFIIDEKYYY